MKDKKFKLISIAFGILLFAALMFQSCVSVSNKDSRFNSTEEGYLSGERYSIIKDKKTESTYLVIYRTGIVKL